MKQTTYKQPSTTCRGYLNGRLAFTETAPVSHDIAGFQGLNAAGCTASGERDIIEVTEASAGDAARVKFEMPTVSCSHEDTLDEQSPPVIIEDAPE